MLEQSDTEKGAVNEREITNVRQKTGCGKKVCVQFVHSTYGSLVRRWAIQDILVCDPLHRYHFRFKSIV